MGKGEVDLLPVIIEAIIAGRRRRTDPAAGKVFGRGWMRQDDKMRAQNKNESSERAEVTEPGAACYRKIIRKPVRRRRLV